MILRKEDTEATLLGEVQSNTVGIDAKNIGLITSLLSTNLYSNPLQSFIRETVSNAWDAHIEANNMEDPILLTINRNAGMLNISIRDYGTGLSEERFNNIYLNLCSSSKRDSNDYIGCMGLGRLSALALSDTVTINNYYEGIVSSYLMYMDGGLIHIDKIFQKDTEEHNGLEVSVSVKDTFSTAKISQALDSIKYFEKVYLESNINFDFAYQNFNDRKIAVHNIFKLCSWPLQNDYNYNCTKQIKVCMGNVLYDLPKDAQLPFYTWNVRYNIDLNIPIGSIDVTPSREALLCNTKSLKVIEDYLEALSEFIHKTVTDEKAWNFNSLEECLSNSLNRIFYIGGIPFVDVKESFFKGYIAPKINIKVGGIDFNLSLYDKEIRHSRIHNKEFLLTRNLFTECSAHLTYSNLFYILKQKLLIVVKDSDYNKKNLRILKSNSLYNSYVIKESFLSTMVTDCYKYIYSRLRRKSYNPVSLEEIKSLKNIYILILKEVEKYKYNLKYFNPKDYIQYAKIDNSDKKKGLKCLAYRYVLNRVRNAVTKEVYDSTKILNPAEKHVFIYGFRGDELFKNLSLFYLNAYTYRPSNKHTNIYHFIEISVRDKATFENLSSAMYYKDFMNTRDNYLAQILTIAYFKKECDVYISSEILYGAVKQHYVNSFNNYNNYCKSNCENVANSLIDLYASKGWLKYQTLYKLIEVSKKHLINKERSERYRRFSADVGIVQVLLQYMLELKHDDTLTFKERKHRITFINKYYTNYEYISTKK